MLQNEVKQKKIRVASMLHSHGVDTCLAEGVHADIVVQGRVHAVNANYVDTKLLEEWEISLASISKSKRVDEVRRFPKWIVSGSNNIA